MSATYRNRQTQINQIIFDQIDLFQSDFFNKIPGLLPGDVTMHLYFNNQVAAWPLVDGTAVSDSQVAAGSVYWNELANGSYGIRFFPNSLGHWNISIAFAPSPSQIVSIDYDVVNLAAPSVDGLRASFC